jgi:protein-tyrosine-phosphatase
MAEGTAPEPTTYNILFVCTGNTCRSALAEGIARASVRRRGWQHVDIGSAGTDALPDLPASPEAVDVAAERGIDLSEHRSRPLTPALVEWADLILTMSSSHLWTVSEMGGADKAGLMTDFLEPDVDRDGIDDPYGTDVETYRATATQLDAAIEAMLDRLAVIVAP